MQFLSCTSNILSAQKPHVASGYHIEQHSIELFPALYCAVHCAISLEVLLISAMGFVTTSAKAMTTNHLLFPRHPHTHPQAGWVQRILLPVSELAFSWMWPCSISGVLLLTLPSLHAALTTITTRAHRVVSDMMLRDPPRGWLSWSNRNRRLSIQNLEFHQFPESIIPIKTINWCQVS